MQVYFISIHLSQRSKSEIFQFMILIMIYWEPFAFGFEINEP